ncbi:MAG: phage GP46 family protein [Rhizobiales bacterium]|nr:phage GP46 family protein [Hyphomicrobiales bacterium]
MEIRIRAKEGILKPPHLGIDTVWNAKLKAFEWVIADKMLLHENALYTAIILCLFTDKRAPEGMNIPDGTSNKRGFWGDSVLLDGEFEIGSFIWTLRRAALDDDLEVKAIDFTVLALQPLLDQKVVADLKVLVTADKANNQLIININAFNTKDNKPISRAFDIWWKQTL